MKTNIWFLSSLCLALALIVFLPDFFHTAKIAPAVNFTSITGQRIALKELQGKVVLITFWATDCSNCIKEIPHLIDLYQTYHAKGLEMVAVTMYYDPPSHVVEMTHLQRLPYPVALDLNAELAQAFDHVQLTPSTFLIAKNGNIAVQKIGVFDVTEMKTQIETLLKG